MTGLLWALRASGLVWSGGRGCGWRSGEDRPDLREGWELARPMGRPQAECAAVGGVGSSLLESMASLSKSLLVASHWWLEISHSRSIYTAEIGNCYKSGLLFLGNQEHLPACHWAKGRLLGTCRDQVPIVIFKIISSHKVLQACADEAQILSCQMPHEHSSEPLHI